MIRPQKRQRHGGHRGEVDNLKSLYGPKSSTPLPRDWRERTERMDVAGYYSRHVDKLTAPNASGWASGRCPFHEDRNASLSVNLTSGRGGWRCHAGCGGGDLIGFHMKRTGLTFTDAVRDLMGVRR